MVAIQNTENNILIRNAHIHEFEAIGKLMVKVYAELESFPKPEEQPQYYQYLSNVGQLTKNKNIELLVAITAQDNLLGAVVFYHDMKGYGSGGTAPQEPNACGFRLLAVSNKARGKGIGKLLTQYCIDKARLTNAQNLVIHTTNAMQIAWSMYKSLGFKRAQDLDFIQGDLEVFGFKLSLNHN